MNPRRHQNGNAMVEFTLVGIPLIFVLLVTFELARGMWLYATVAHAVREGARYAAVHGADCSTPPNNCAVTVAQVAAVIRDAGAGLLPDDFEVSLVATGPDTTPSVTPTPLSTLLTNTSAFPTGTASVAGNDVVVTGVYYLRTALTAFLSTPPETGAQAGSIRLGSTSRERIEF